MGLPAQQTRRTRQMLRRRSRCRRWMSWKPSGVLWWSVRTCGLAEMGPPCLWSRAQRSPSNVAADVPPVTDRNIADCSACVSTLISVCEHGIRAPKTEPLCRRHQALTLCWVGWHPISPFWVRMHMFVLCMVQSEDAGGPGQNQEPDPGEGQTAVSEGLGHTELTWRRAGQAFNSHRC